MDSNPVRYMNVCMKISMLNCSPKKGALTNVRRIHSLTTYRESVGVTGHNERQLKEKKRGRQGRRVEDEG